MSILFVGRPGDGQTAWATSEPPAVLVVDDSGGLFVWSDGVYRWLKSPD